MIKFRCTNCGMEFTVPDADAGKRGGCPKCRTVLVVPQKIEIELQKEVFENLERESSSSQTIPAKTKFNEYENQIETDRAAGIEQEQAESVPVRKLPAILDIFLYPTSIAGLTMIGIVIGMIFLLNAALGLMGPLVCLFWLPVLIILVVILAYTYWYICQCIRDSAEGGIRAPDVLVNSPTLADMLIQTFRFIFCLLIFAAPVLYYYLHTKRVDNIFYIISGLSVFFFPMGLLSVIMCDSLWGLNPFVLIKSVFKTMIQYTGLVLLFYIIFIFIIYQIAQLDVPAVLILLTTALNFYFLIVAAHLLGRFYWRYQDRLGWDV